MWVPVKKGLMESMQLLTLFGLMSGDAGSGSVGEMVFLKYAISYLVIHLECSDIVYVFFCFFMLIVLTVNSLNKTKLTCFHYFSSTKCTTKIRKDLINWEIDFWQVFCRVYMKVQRMLSVFKNMWYLSAGAGKDIKSSARVREEEKCECFQLYIAAQFKEQQRKCK